MLFGVINEFVIIFAQQPMHLVNISCAQYQLHLRSAFGTSHSLTTTRTNALITITCSKFVAHGEVGLPPKKPHCYLADFNDVQLFCTLYIARVQQFLSKYQSLEDAWDSNDGMGTNITNYVNREQHSKTLLRNIPVLLFKALDACDPSTCRAAQSGIEMAILDLWAQMEQVPLYQLLALQKPTNKVAFYTAALNPDISEIEKSTLFGLKHTPYLKIKLDDDIAKGKQILTMLCKLYANVSTPYLWSIDANSAWTPEISLQYLDMLKSDFANLLDAKILYMIEQPFPVTIAAQVAENPSLHDAWLQVKQAYEKHGVLVYGDESISTSETIHPIHQLMHGVNIKLEKAGGFRGALDAVKVAQTYQLHVWFGMMVASVIASTAPAHLMSLASIGGDLDGALLTAQATIDNQEYAIHGGFSFGTKQQYGHIVLDDAAPGLGLKQ